MKLIQWLYDKQAPIHIQSNPGYGGAMQRALCGISMPALYTTWIDGDETPVTCKQCLAKKAAETA